MTTLRHADAVEAKRSCPACSAGILVRGILAMKRIYLCDCRRLTHDQETAKEDAREARRAEATQ